MLRYLTAGESHGPQLTAILDGLPAGLTISLDGVNFQLSRRQKGYGRGGRMKIESDAAEVVSGLRGSVTMGGPITIVIRNKDWENWTNIMDPIAPVATSLNLREERLAQETTTPRPGHADLPGGIKWNHKDLRNVLERASARETAARVAIGSCARQLLEKFGVVFASHVVRVGEVALPEGYKTDNLHDFMETAERSDVRCIDETVGTRMAEAIKEAKNSRDSLGGVVELIVRGLPVGLGGFSQWDHRLDGRLAQALMSIHSVKGVEIGIGFEGASRRGSEYHDEIYYSSTGYDTRKGYYRKTNNAGGLEGGMTNGEDLVVRIANKPISTLNRPLQSVNVVTHVPAEAMVERTDTCVVPALAVVCEAVAALVLCDAFLDKFGGDNMAEIERNYRAFLADHY